MKLIGDVFSGMRLSALAIAVAPLPITFVVAGAVALWKGAWQGLYRRRMFLQGTATSRRWSLVNGVILVIAGPVTMLLGTVMTIVVFSEPDLQRISRESISQMQLSVVSSARIEYSLLAFGTAALGAYLVWLGAYKGLVQRRYYASGPRPPIVGAEAVAWGIYCLVLGTGLWITGLYVAMDSWISR